MAKRKKNYLNNKDMLKEIHLSKNSYCSFRDPKIDSQYDYIVDDVNEIFDTTLVENGKDSNGDPIYIEKSIIDLAKEERADRLTKEGIPTDTSDIHIDDLVFRVMTTEHLPLVPKKKSKTDANTNNSSVYEDLLDEEEEDEFDGDIKIIGCEELIPMRVNFPSFFHYRITCDSDITDEQLIDILKSGQLPLTVVGKSHWKGDLVTGEFSQSHGQTTPNLAMMYLKLVERYATRSNWRGYCVTNDVETLTQRGWLNGDQLTEDDKILSFNGNHMIWSNIKSIFRDDNYDGKMFYLYSKNIDSLVTPGHKIPTDDFKLMDVNTITNESLLVMGPSTMNLSEFGIPNSNKTTVEKEYTIIKTANHYKGKVWCPETEYGCFVARRNGKVYLTGNSYNDEMQGQSLLQLSQVGLRFNEKRSQNPFAYYSSILGNAFTRVLNIEKKMQTIRDDILEQNGLAPSWTRQFEHEFNQELKTHEENDDSDS